MNRNPYYGYTSNPDMHPYYHVPPFSNLHFTIDFTNCATRQGTQGNIHVLLENHLINTHYTAFGDEGWTGALVGEAQAFLETIAPNAVLTSIFNDGYVK